MELDSHLVACNKERLWESGITNSREELLHFSNADPQYCNLKDGDDLN